MFEIAFKTFSGNKSDGEDFSVANSSELVGGVLEFGHEVVGEDEGGYDEVLVHKNPPECVCGNSIVRLFMNGFN